MKTPARLVIAAAIAVVVYPIASWYSGKVVEDVIAQQFASLDTLPPGIIEVVEHKFERRFFSSTQTVTFTLPFISERKLTLRSEISHGPFTSGGFAAAASDDKLAVESLSPKIVAALGDKALFESHTVYGFSGGARIAFASPALDLKPKGPEDSAHVVWGGLTGIMDVFASMTSGWKPTRYLYVGNLPKLRLEDEDFLIELNGLAFESDQKRVFDDDDLFFAGPQKLSVAGFIAKFNKKEEGKPQPPIDIQQVKYDTNTSLNGDFASVVVRSGAETIKVGENSYGPAHYDISLNHLHTRTLAELSNILLKFQLMNFASLDDLSEESEDQAAQAMVALAMTITQPLFELLEQAPDISLDRISFTTPQGEASLSLRATVKDFKAQEAFNPAAWLPKIDASGEIAAPLALLESLDDAQKMRIEDMRAQGYLTEENGIVKATTEFREGQLTVNGKAFDTSLSAHHDAEEETGPDTDKAASKAKTGTKGAGRPEINQRFRSAK
ncbi:MAG: YdgA family protein [Azoarcus sp.]|jgi:uncharacterized protein YdgA (DUF945 family)|nr:YdgA family protein [Azoarcus sp.]